MAPKTSKPPVLDTFHAVVGEFSEFLTVAVHTILYERDIYPRASFLSARKYNYPVRQNRHPEVCKWIMDAVAAVEVEMLKGTVSSTSLVIYSALSHPLERYVFSTSAFPIIDRTDHFIPIETPISDPTANDTTNPTTNPPTDPAPPPPPAFIPPHTPLIDLHSQFRALFARLSTLTGTLSPLPPLCTFTIAIELRDPSERRPDGTPAGEAPIGHPMPWIPAEPGMQPADPDPAPQAATSSLDTGASSSHGLGSGSSAPPTAEAGQGVGGSEAPEAQAEGMAAQEGPKKRVPLKGRYRTGQRLRPVRTIEAGPFAMEFWVEEGKDKVEAVRAARKQAELDGYGQEEEEEE
ncbi:hypothetical protein MMC13_005431 [Lambiella insularis]|nr:hypothetical protein [Lambiella insularis]